MNNSYFNYFKIRNPIKFISNIFRNYKKSCDGKGSIKRNQSEPVVTNSKISTEKLCLDKQKSAENLPVTKADTVLSSTSRESLKVTWSNIKFQGSSSSINLQKKSSQLDLSYRERLENMPVNNIFNEPEISRGVYPWQNFNIDNEEIHFEET
ncbi:hypothetical protein JTB14_000088 [Gonioctena quinquepunctata]|nr:hypothetical protein JTB14_000088 [Gonioctena quinquepunctata]